MNSFQAGDVIRDKYEVVRVLGEGGMGLVLAVRHREADVLMALKFLLPALRDNAVVCARFAREARTCMRLKNEHVARVHDVDTFNGTPFMVMEHLSGEDLASMLERRGQLPIAESVDLLLQACEALAEAHKLGIVHRDLKPGNLFVTAASDGTPFVKVLDFGISKTSTDSVSVTASTAPLGTPRYMSPEQLMDAASVDSRSDVWSLGAILYEMLAGAPAFGAPPSSGRPSLPVFVLHDRRWYRKPSCVAGSAARSKATKSWTGSTKSFGRTLSRASASSRRSSSRFRHGGLRTRMRFPPDLVAVLAAFGGKGVRYLVVGGHAVGVHARPRSTKDLDVWLDHDPSNIARACKALHDFGAPANVVEALRTATRDEIVWMGRVPARIDFLLSIPGATFESAWPNRVDIRTDGVTVHVIGKRDLIANKRAVGRPMDKSDVRALERVAVPRRSRRRGQE